MINKNPLILFAAAAFLGQISVEAATVTVSPGFNSANSITTSLFNGATFTVAVGSWDGSTFIRFGQSVTDTAA